MLPGERWFFQLTHVKNYRSSSLLACSQNVIRDLFPWKRTVLAGGQGWDGGAGHVKRRFRAKQGGKSKSS